MSGEKPREIAVRLLGQRKQGGFVETLLDRALEGIGWKPEDRRLLQELVYGVVRWQLTLDWLIDQKTGGKPQKPLVQDLLRLALYQMFWLDRVPSYAAVNETVEICKNHHLLPQAKFLNAVLRGYSREAEATRATLEGFKKKDLSLGFSHPEWLCRNWAQRWGYERTRSLLEWNNLPPPSFARVNTLKTTPAELAKLWGAEGVKFEEAVFDWAPIGTIYKLVYHPSLQELPSFQAGLFYIQDPSTLLAPEMLDAKPGERILDLCAAPGGKTTWIAQKMQNQGRILAEDLDPNRLKLVTANCGRLGVSCVGIEPAEFPPNTQFDRALVDAPCSNTGVMRRRVELRWRITPEEIQRLSALQLKLVGAAAERLRPGGTLVYSTCSLEQEENTGVVQEFLANHPAFRLERQRELTPMENGTDGAFCAQLIRAAS